MQKVFEHIIEAVSEWINDGLLHLGRPSSGLTPKFACYESWQLPLPKPRDGWDVHDGVSDPKHA